jgi:Ca2+-binding RTX toxin-like protein
MARWADDRGFDQTTLQDSQSPFAPAAFGRFFVPPPDTVVGTGGKDFIHVSGDGLTAPPGYNDIPGATAGDDSINAGKGDDIIYAGSGSDLANGSLGNDTINGGGSVASPSDDFYSDALYGGDGDDALFGGEGDLFDGGTGVNSATIDLSQSGYSYHLDLNAMTSGAFYRFHDGPYLMSVYGAQITHDTEVRSIQHIGELDLGSGNDHVTAAASQFHKLLLGDGNDIVEVTGSLSGTSVIDGGGGTDALTLDADASLIEPGMVQGFERLTFTGAHDYGFVYGTGDEGILRIDASSVDSAHSLYVDAMSAASVNPHAVFLGGAGDDRVFVGNGYLNTQQFNGGSGNDTVYLRPGADFTFTFANSTITNVETIKVSPITINNITCNLKTSDGNVAAGQTLTVDGTDLGHLGSIQSLKFNGTAETDGHFVLLGGQRNDGLTGGHLSDTLNGGLGADALNGFGGGDTFVYQSAQDSNTHAFDRITGFDASADKIDLWYSVSAIDAPLAGDYAQLSQIADADHLGIHDALLFSATDGYTYLVIDANGVAGYQDNQDLVIRLVSPQHLDSLSTSTFIQG